MGRTTVKLQTVAPRPSWIPEMTKKIDRGSARQDRGPRRAQEMSGRGKEGRRSCGVLIVGRRQNITGAHHHGG